MSDLMKDLEDLFNVFDGVLYKDLFQNNLMPITSVKKIQYPTDFIETDKGLEIDLAALGLDKKDIDINVKDKILTVSYDKKDEIPKKYIYKGITRKSFKKSWRIDDRLNINLIEAKLEKGLLKITIPFAEEKKNNPVKIEVK